MRTSVKKFLIFVFAGAVYLIGQFFANPQFFGYCMERPYKYDFCLAYAAVNIGWPLIAAGHMLAIAGIILLFANARALRNWLWMSVVYLPLAAIMVIWYTPTAPCIFMCGPPDYENMTRNLGYLYILITLVIVLLSWWPSRKLPS